MIYLLSIISISVVILSFCLRRSIAYLWFCTLIIFFYHVDAIYTIRYGYLFLSTTYSRLGYHSDDMEFVVIYATLIILLVSLMNVVLGRKSIVNYEVNIFLKRSYYWVSGLVLLFVLFAIYRSLSGVNILKVLYSRQAFYSENLLASLALYITPSLAMVGFIGCLWAEGNFRKFYSVVVFCLCIVISVFTGSRSAFILSAILPCFVYYLFFKARLSNRSLISKKNIAYGLMGILVVLLLSSYYRDATRGDQNSVNFLVSADLVSLDSSVYVVQSGIEKSNTYLSAFSFFIPRTIWSSKPVSGNYYLTNSLFPERFDASGAEITASLVGEGFINYGVYGIVSASILLFLLIISSEILLRRGGWWFPLALIFIFRGSNILRGDLLNIVVPLFFAFFVFLLASWGTRVNNENF